MVIEEAETPLMPWYPSHMPMRKTSGVSIEQIDNAPTIDAVPVVRCKDCKYGDTGIDEEGKSFWKCIGIHYGGTKPMNFCSYGERRDDEID